MTQTTHWVVGERSGSLFPSGCPPQVWQPGRPEWTFDRERDEFAAKYWKLWNESGVDSPAPLDPVTARERRGCEREADELIAWLQDWVKQYPEAQSARAAWREPLLDRLRSFSESVLGFSERCGAVLFSGPYRRATADFMRQARAFDPTLKAEDLFQAMRNVWIANSIQLLLDRPVTLTPPVFAYSMLYPYTDNLLDDPEVPAAVKQEMSCWLTGRLRGSPALPQTSRERDIGQLLDIIDRTYPVPDFPELHWSLQAIHQAQTDSLRQHSPVPFSDAAELGPLSVAKGGASVLADGFLVAGKLTRPQADFLFGYGVVLQFLDDLQDVGRDLEARHHTVFTSGAAQGPLDGLTNRLHGFIARVFQSADGLAEEGRGALQELITTSCGLMIPHAVASHPQFYTREYSACLETGSRFSFRFIRERRGTIERASQKAWHALERRHELDSVLCVLD